MKDRLSLEACGVRNAGRFIQAVGSRTLSMLLAIALIMSAAVIVGCQSTSSAKYVSPRVEGRVVDAQSHAAIEGVEVQRYTPSNDAGIQDTARGGETMEQAPTVVTGTEGRFILDSQRDLALFRTVGWYSVSVSFRHPAYKRLIMTYSYSQSVKTAEGEPLVKAGDISLVPVDK